MLQEQGLCDIIVEEKRRKAVKKAFIIAIAGFCTLLILCTALFFFVNKHKKEKELLEAVESYRVEKNKKFSAENEKYGDYEVDVAFLGDSLTDGYDLEKYYPDYLVSNRGIGGDTTFDLEARLENSVYALKPKAVVLLIGANNLSTMHENYENILLGLRENLPETEVILLSLTSMGQEWGKGNALAAYNNVRIKKLADKYGFTYVDIYTPLMDVETGQIYPEYTVDGGHLTQKGYEVLTENIAPVLEEVLNTRKKEV